MTLVKQTFAEKLVQQREEQMKLRAVYEDAYSAVEPYYVEHAHPNFREDFKKTYFVVVSAKSAEHMEGARKMISNLINKWGLANTKPTSKHYETNTRLLETIQDSLLVMVEGKAIKYMM